MPHTGTCELQTSRGPLINSKALSNIIKCSCLDHSGYHVKAKTQEGKPSEIIIQFQYLNGFAEDFEERRQIRKTKKTESGWPGHLLDMQHRKREK